MGLPLLVIGLLMIIVGVRGTYAQFGQQVASEFTGGKGSFTYWLIAIAAVGAIGYIPEIKRLSRWLMALIVLSIFLSHKGFFAQFQNALNTGPKAPNPVQAGSSGQSTSAGAGQAIQSIIGPQTGNPPTAQAAQAAGAGTINTWLQSLPGIGSWFTPPAAGSPAPLF